MKNPAAVTTKWKIARGGGYKLSLARWFRGYKKVVSFLSSNLCNYLFYKFKKYRIYIYSTLGNGFLVVEVVRTPHAESVALSSQTVAVGGVR